MSYDSSTGVTILGSTGSISIHTLEVLSLHSDQYHVEALSANYNVNLMFEQCRRYLPERVVMVDSASAKQLKERIADANLSIEVFSEETHLSDIAAQSGDIVVCGIVGAAGLLSTPAAVQSDRCEAEALPGYECQ